MSIGRRNAKIIRAGIMSGRRFIAAARSNPGWASGNLSGLHGEAHIRTVLRAGQVLTVPLGSYEGEGESLARAWDEGWHAHYLEWDLQRNDPTHPITSTNPYRNKLTGGRS